MPVRVVDFTCVVTGKSFTNTRAHDWRAEARSLINTRLGQSVDTRLPGVRLVADRMLP